MSNRWFATGAFADTPFAAQVDTLFSENALDKKRLLETDVFFISADDPRREMLPKHLLLLDRILPDEDIENVLARFGGADFLSRIGHDIVNSFSPLLEHRLLSEATLSAQVKQGIRLGKQVNIIGHLLQKDLSFGENLPLDEFLLHLGDKARRHGIGIAVKHEGETPFSFPSVPARLVEPLVEEIILNWLIHSSGGERVVVSVPSRVITFINDTLYQFPYAHLKAILRRPFQKFGRMDGNGLGLFIIGLIAYTGGFSWDIAAREGRFSLSFSFGASPSPVGNAAR